MKIFILCNIFCQKYVMTIKHWTYKLFYKTIVRNIFKFN